MLSYTVYSIFFSWAYYIPYEQANFGSVVFFLNKKKILTTKKWIHLVCDAFDIVKYDLQMKA